MGRKAFRDAFDQLFEPITESGCWIWMGGLHNDGYGRFSASFKGPRILAHRYAFERKHGEIPARMLICHRCDVPACVNPDHLFLGTVIDNNRDRSLKQRSARGEKSGKAKLTADQVLEIRAAAVKRNGGIYDLARKFSVSHYTIRDIRRGRNWEHLS